MSTPDLRTCPSSLLALPTDAGQLASAAATAGLGFHEVNLTTCDNLAKALGTIGSALHFPDWFGNNLDALMDCLLDLSWLPTPGQVLILTGTASLQNADAEGFEALLEVLAEAQRTWAADQVPFWVFADAPDLPPASTP